jgi:hypothetical protein
MYGGLSTGSDQAVETCTYSTWQVLRALRSVLSPVQRGHLESFYFHRLSAVSLGSVRTEALPFPCSTCSLLRV